MGTLFQPVVDMGSCRSVGSVGRSGQQRVYERKGRGFVKKPGPERKEKRKKKRKKKREDAKWFGWGGKGCLKRLGSNSIEREWGLGDGERKYVVKYLWRSEKVLQ